MNLEQLLKLDNISDYYILWYGAECVDTYFDKSGFCKDTVELTRCKPIGDNTIYLFMSGINRKTCNYQCAAKLHPTEEASVYSFERVNISRIIILLQQRKIFLLMRYGEEKFIER